MEYQGGKRINQMRFKEARATKAQVVATACPYCLHMLEDAAKAKETEGSPHVKDLAELIAEHLD
jgi:Fe-S oxidoreductase